MKKRARLYSVTNREKCNANKKKWNLANPEKAAAFVRFATLKKNFGISRLEYNALYLKQKGCCALCTFPESILRRSLAVDHDHKTGRIRGLLCFNCNTSLGKFKENPELLLKAVKYITEVR